MDKNIMDNVKKDKIDVHHRFGEMSELQQAYGLRILGGSSWRTNKDSYYKCPTRYFEFYSISFMYDGDGKFWSEETGEIDIKPPSFVLVSPHVVNRYGGAHGKTYAEDSVIFYGDIADRLLRSGVFKTGVYPTSILRKVPAIVEKSRNPSVQSQLNANMDLQNLIFEIYNESKSVSSKPDVIHRVLAEINANVGKWYQVSELAELAEMSIATFRRKFQQETGMLPKRYIEELKINSAADDLLKLPLKISEIALRYGYFDCYHFSRRFKIIKGCSPEQYRKTYS